MVSENEPTTKGNKVLIVDDVNFFLDVQRHMLSQVECDILTARSGLEALRIIKKNRPQLVLLDYNMPDLNGDKTCEIVKRDPRYRDIPIVIVSSEPGEDVKNRCLAAGADYYLTKPVDQMEFIEAVSRLLRVRSSLYYPRVFLRSEVYLRGKGEIQRMMTVDISLTGIFLETTNPVEVGETVTVHLTIPVPRKNIEVTARVTKIVTEEEMQKTGLFPGMALEFLSLDLEDRRYIEQYIDHAVKMNKRDLSGKDSRIHFV
ncbi:MAG: response regulator [Deltaproteobacteria bacterium]|nr:response regulator [Candidatus Zymogenaceae bacterium]